MKKKNTIKRTIAIMMGITLLMSTSIVSFAQEISPVQNEITELSYTLGQVITRLEGTASGDNIKSKPFYINEPVTISLILGGRTQDGNGFVRFRLYDAQNNKYIVIKDLDGSGSSATVHIHLLEGRYSLEAYCSTGGEYMYSGTVMVYQL